MRTTTKQRPLLMRAAAVLLLALCAAQTAGAWSGGQGTEADPYQIASAAELQQLATAVNNGTTTYESVYFRQTAAIDMAGKTMSPIGNYDHPFMGHYDGYNFTISHLTITGSTLAALFGHANGISQGQTYHPSSLKNIVLTDCNIDVSSVTNSYAAGICAKNGSYNTVENCRVSGTIKGNYAAGGIVGQQDNGKVQNCFADVTVTASVQQLSYGNQSTYCSVGKIIGYVEFLGSAVTGNYYCNDGATDGTGAAITAIGRLSSTTYPDAGRATPVYTDSGTSGLTVSGGTPVVSLNGTNYYTKGTTYTIYDAAGWNFFCDFLNDNDTHNRFSGKTVRLGADITVSRMAGSSGHDFCGTFDGQEHTLTFNYGTAGSYASEQNIAPFSYVSNVGSEPATIKNLHVAGDIYTSAKYAAGIVGQHWGTLTIENCRSSIVIHSSVADDGTHGGIEAASNGPLNITGCVFDGKLLTTGTTATTNCGGFVGFGALSVSNSLYAPAALSYGETEITSGSATFVRNSSAGSNCYYTRTLGTAQGKQARSITASGNATLAHAGVATEYSVSGITAYKSGGTFTSGILYNNVLYAGSGDAVSLTSTSSVDDGYQLAVTYNDGTADHALSPDVDGKYTITMPAANVTVTANIIVIPWDGDGTEGNPYLIKYVSQLDLLAHRVNGTHGETCQSDGYENKFFQLDKDISYPHTSAWNASASTENNYEAIGGVYNGGNRYFRGHFDGNKKTISGIRIYKGGSSSADYYQGIFGRTNGADIHDLTLADARITGHNNTGGIVGYNEGGTVSGCHVADDVAVCAVQSDAYYHGGIAGYNYNGTIEQCTSAATLTLTNASKSRYYGGIAGYNEGGTLRDNLAIGATVPAAADNTYGAITGYTGGTGGTLQRNYYANCTVADTENATGVGCGNADVTDNDGAVPGYLLTLGEGVTSSAWSITIPKHKELNGNGQLVTVAAVTYNVAAAGTTVRFNSGETEGYSASYSVNGSPVSGNSITMPAAAVNVTSNGGAPIDVWGMAGGADGSSGHPYIITTAEGWNLLARNVAAGKSYSDKYFQLGADNISISTMVGTNGHPFSGHFNGNGNTLAVDITSAGEYTAPFRYVSGATITGVHTTGTVTTAHKFATGLVGRHDGNVTISNCRSSVAIVSSVSGAGTHGGFVATGSGTATIEGCLFDGVICTTAFGRTNSCGGFVGWNGGTVNISNSLYAPVSVPEGKYAILTDDCATFARNGADIANSYYTQTLGDAQGKQRHSISKGAYITDFNISGTATQYTVSGITAYATGIKYGDVLYAGSGDAVSLTLANNAGKTPEGYQDNGYTVSVGTLSGTGNPYTLTMPDADVTVAFSRQVIPWDGDGSEGNPYLIKNASQLDLLAHRVNGTHGETANGYSGTYFQLDKDISYPHTSDWDDFTSDDSRENNFEAIGGSNSGIPRFFRGHFDGNNKTISGIRIYKGGNGDADRYQGIFGWTDGADIHDLTLADARITGYDQTGGIVGRSANSTVSDCYVAADVAVCAVQSDAYYHGGIAGWNNGTISGCTSAVTLTLAEDISGCKYYGGIAGGSDGTLTDNLAIGATVPAANNNRYGAITGSNNGTLVRNYYVNCKVAGVENATGVGCQTADVTTNDGAVPNMTVTLAPAGYATFYDSRVDLVLPAGTKAYVVTAKGEAEGTLTYEKIADGDNSDNGGNVVPAKTAVLLQTAAATEANSVQPTLRLPKADAYDGTNLLHGSDVETTTTGGGIYYKLTYGEDNSAAANVFGWYWGEADGAAFTSPAHKAWLALPSAGARMFIGLPDDDETTGAKSLTPGPSPKGEGSDSWYTLDGRRLNGKPTTKGLYIINGKKVIIK